YRGGRARAVRPPRARLYCAGFASRRRGFRFAGGGMRSSAPTRRAVLAGLAVSGAALRPPRVWAEYPSRSVRIIAPFPAGGGAAIVSRLIQPQLQHALGQPFVVENRAGAAGRIGAALVARAEGDGHTLLTTTESSLVIAPHTGAALGYDPV